MSSLNFSTATSGLFSGFGSSAGASSLPFPAVAATVVHPYDFSTASHPNGVGQRLLPFLNCSFDSSPPPQPPLSLSTSLSSVDRHQKQKLKRTRQRVDAGEPRNTYSTISNYPQLSSSAAATSRQPSQSFNVSSVTTAITALTSPSLVNLPIKQQHSGEIVGGAAATAHHIKATSFMGSEDYAPVCTGNVGGATMRSLAEQQQQQMLLKAAYETFYNNANSSAAAATYLFGSGGGSHGYSRPFVGATATASRQDHGLTNFTVSSMTSPSQSQNEEDVDQKPTRATITFSANVEGVEKADEMDVDSEPRREDNNDKEDDDSDSAHVYDFSGRRNEDVTLEVKQKKARVENIISSMQCTSPNPSTDESVHAAVKAQVPAATGGAATEDLSCSACSSPDKPHQTSEFDMAVSDSQKRSSSVGDTPRSKRKQYHPHQVELGTVSAATTTAAMIIKGKQLDAYNQKSQEAYLGDGGSEQTSNSSGDNLAALPSPTAALRQDSSQVNDQLKQIRRELFLLQQRYIEMLTEHQKRVQIPVGTTVATSTSNIADSLFREAKGPLSNSSDADRSEDTTVLLSSISTEWTAFAQNLKTELFHMLFASVDKVLDQYLQIEATRVANFVSVLSRQQLQQQRQQQRQQQQTLVTAESNLETDLRLKQSNISLIGTESGLPSGSRPPFYFTPLGYAPLGFPPYAAAGFAAMSSCTPVSRPSVTNAVTSHSIFPALNVPGFSPFDGILPPESNGKTNGGGNDASSTVGIMLHRKRRTKVTDTRLARLSLRPEEGAGPGAMLQTPTIGVSYAGASYPTTPTMVPHSGPINCSYGLGEDELDVVSSDDVDSETAIDFSEATGYDPSLATLSCTLTPMHLRKAKLMFFFSRYPSSSLLKAFFPDIRFNKNNTAQLVKWFSNFREFYYIQMEKYARQTIAEGVQSVEDIHVSCDSEVYKILNMHYNRNNHLQVPANFRRVVQATLREFFVAVQAGRDMEPSWKKAIYKVIARLDDPIPEYFKSANFLAQLE